MAKVVKPRSPVSRHYVNNKDLLEAIKRWQAAKRGVNDPDCIPPLPDEVGRAILMISERLSLRPNFISYSYRDEMIGDAIENMVSAAGNFDTGRFNNPFAYFTTIAFMAFIRRIEKEKREAYVKYKNFDNQFMYPGQTDMIDDATQLTKKGGNVNVDEFIANFERKITTNSKKAKRKAERGFM